LKKHLFAVFLLSIFLFSGGNAYSEDIRIPCGLKLGILEIEAAEICRDLSWKSSEDGAGLKVFIRNNEDYILSGVPFHNVRYIFEKSEMVAVSATTRSVSARSSETVSYFYVLLAYIESILGKPLIYHPIVSTSSQLLKGNATWETRRAFVDLFHEMDDTGATILRLAIRNRDLVPSKQP